MVCLSTGGRASHLAISSLQSTELNGLLYALRTVLLLPHGTSIILPFVDRKRVTGKNGGAI